RLSQGLDLEAEHYYRALAHVHPQIFVQLPRDVSSYRARAGAEGRATLGLKCGPGPRQTLDIFQAATGAAAPLALFIHGGWWRSLEPSQFSHMAAGLNARGVLVAVAGHDLSPPAASATPIPHLRQRAV